MAIVNEGGDTTTVLGGTPPAETVVVEAPARTPEEQTAYDAMTPEAKAADDAARAKPKDEKPAGAPEAYEAFKAPEGVVLDEAMVGDFSTVAKELNLTQEQAQKMVDFAIKRHQSLDAANQTEYTALREGWVNAAKADTEFGGANYDTNIGLAVKALDTFGTPELRKALDLTGAGDHPEVLRVFVRIGKAISEDSLRFGKGDVTPQAKSTAEVMYPSMQPKS
jgi:hypothetical protein